MEQPHWRLNIGEDKYFGIIEIATVEMIEITLSENKAMVDGSYRQTAEQIYSFIKTVHPALCYYYRSVSGFSSPHEDDIYSAMEYEIAKWEQKEN